MQIKEFENLPKNKGKKTIKLVKRAVRTRWLSSEAAADDVFKEYSHLIHAFESFNKNLNQEALPKIYSKRWTTSSFYQLYTYYLHAVSSDNTQQNLSNWRTTFFSKLTLPLRKLYSS